MNAVSSVKYRPISRLVPLVFFFVAGMFVFMLTLQLVSKVDIEQLIVFCGYGLLLGFLAYSSYARARGREFADNAATLAVLRVVWLFLLIDDILFNFGRLNPLSSELQGKFTPAAYGEVILWMVSAVILAVITVPLSKEVAAMLFMRPYRWMTIFLMACVGSVIYSVSPGYSLAWSFKLAIDIWMVLLLSATVWDEGGIRSILRTTALSIGLVMVMALLQLLIDPKNAFVEGRLGGIAHPTVLSELGGLLLLIALIAYALEKAKWSIPAALLSSLVMMLGAGKIAIVAALVSVGLFFVLQKKTGSGVMVVVGLLVVGLTVLLLSPTGGYFARYAHSDQAGSLTGRMELWKAQIPEIKQKILLGHGYLASKFVPAPFKEGDWQVGSLHNAYLDVLYNLGIVGLFIVLMMNYWIIRNLLFVRKHAGNPETFAVSCGLLAIYLNLLINSPFAVPFGSRPYAFFMVFLLILGLSHRLRQMISVFDVSHVA